MNKEELEKIILEELKKDSYLLLWDFYRKYFDKKMLFWDDLMRKMDAEGKRGVKK